MKVKVIANKPQTGQDSIDHLIGKVYETVRQLDDDEPDRVSVNAPEFKGLIVLNPGEYEKVPE